MRARPGGLALGFLMFWGDYFRVRRGRRRGFGAGGVRGVSEVGGSRWDGERRGALG